MDVYGTSPAPMSADREGLPPQLEDKRKRKMMEEQEEFCHHLFKSENDCFCFDSML